MKKSYWTLANLFSLANAFCGLMSMASSLNHDFVGAARFILAGVMFDFLDGKAARFFRKESTFGKSLDSLSDIITFGVAPAIFVFAFSGGHGVLALMAISLFVLAGAWRLAFYIQWSKAFRPPGMPITFNGIFFPILYFLHGNGEYLILLLFVSTGLMVLPIFFSSPSVS